MEALRNRGGALWQALRLTLWFLPGLMALGGVALFALTYALDSRIQASTSVTGLPIFFAGSAAAARALLSAIVGSLITVIATIFSVTIVTLQLASSQYSPRLLQRFMSDRLVQVVLGTYAATFVYAILVLRIVREPDAAAGAFTPLISVPVALVLALVSVGLLVYFIHHIANMSQSSSIVRAVHDDGLEAISKLEPLESPDENPEQETGEKLPEWKIGKPAAVVGARESGYVRLVENRSLLRALANKKEPVFVEITVGPGTYLIAGLPAARLWFSGEERLSAEEERQIEKAVVVGPERTMLQDPTFSIRQLSDIALKGLSPGINDPTTAVQALNSLGSMLVALGSKELPRRLTEHESDGVRKLVWIGYPSFDEVVEMAFDQVRRAAFTSGQVAFLERIIDIIEQTLAVNGLPERREALWKQIYLLARQSTYQIPDSHDAVNLSCRGVSVGASLLHTSLRDRIVADLEELAGLCKEVPGGGRVKEAVDLAVEDAESGVG